MVALHHHHHWRDAAIAKSEVLTDAWEVTKTWAGRLAEWVLFACMVANIIEILPGVQMWGWLGNTILGVQAVTLDIAGFGLATMAEQARLSGETKTAATARRTAYLLIGLMMVTVLSVSIGTLWPAYKPFTDMADKVLILVRVAMTVVYGHVLHDLRQHTSPTIPTPVIEEHLLHLAERVDMLQQRQDGHLQVIIREVECRIASLPQPEPINYVLLAERMTPLLPQPATPDLTPLVEQMSRVTTCVQSMMQHHGDSEHVDTTDEDTTTIRDAEHVDTTNGDTDEDVDTTDEDVDTPVALSAYRPKHTTTQKRPQVQTTSYGAARAEAERIIEQCPQVGATELARRANISRSYAQRLLSATK